jgi:endonuclease/exonuclease/phosphatase (EEP) superfamily protein YafD
MARHPVGRQQAGVLAWWCSWFYLGAVLFAYIPLCVTGDRWWPAAFLLFGPRWALLVPLALLLPVALWARRWMLPPLIGAALVVIGPVMGFCLPVPPFDTDGLPRLHVRILTCNVDGRHADTDNLKRLIAESDPDVVALQEWPAEADLAVLVPGGWHGHQGRGLCLISRYPVRLAAVTPNEEGWRDLINAYRLDSPGGALHFFNVHLDTPRPGLQAVLRQRWGGIPELKANLALCRRGSQTASRLVTATEEAGGAVLVAGDFNMPTDSAIYRDNWAGLTNAFSSAGFGWGYTKQARWFGVRIDHIIAGRGWRCRRCLVGPEVGSDHRPLLADIDWVGSTTD